MRSTVKQRCDFTRHLFVIISEDLFTLKTWKLYGWGSAPNPARETLQTSQQDNKGEEETEV